MWNHVVLRILTNDDTQTILKSLTLAFGLFDLQLVLTSSFPPNWARSSVPFCNYIWMKSSARGIRPTVSSPRKCSARYRVSVLLSRPRGIHFNICTMLMASWDTITNNDFVFKIINMTTEMLQRCELGWASAKAITHYTRKLYHWTSLAFDVHCVHRSLENNQAFDGKTVNHLPQD